MKRFIEKALILTGKALQFLHLLRVQIFVALLVALLIPIGVGVRNGTFIGLADAIGSYSLAIITLSLFLLAWTLHITTRLVLIYGPERYGIPNITCPPTNPTPWRRFLHSPWFTLTIAAILPIPTIIDLWRNTCLPPTSHKVIAITLGLIAAIVSLVIAATVHDWLEAEGGTTAEQLYPTIFIIHPGANRTPDGRFHTDTANLRIASDRAMAGLFKDGDLRSGHQAAIIFVAIFFLIYAAFFFGGLSPHSYPHLPAALFFAYLLVTWVTWILAGLSFTLDRFHIPVLSSLLILSLALSTLWRTDHEFNVLKKGNSLSPVTPPNVVDAWRKTHPSASNGPIVVITAEGGGIEAAAWANLVLTRLEKATNGRLHDSVVLFSSVSGGSTGAYYYLDQFGSKDNSPTFTDKDSLKNASDSTLSAVGWGFAYPDFARTVPLLGWLVPEQFDRGYTLEQAWRQNSGSQATMTSWMNDTSGGFRPAVIFNATGAETGQPVLFGTTQLSTTFPWFQGPNDQQLEQQFFLTFSASDLNVSTAARMSAAFPYVSPEARPAESLLDDYTATPPPPGQMTFKSSREAWDAQRLHVADGGLFDNTGVVSAVHWIYDLSQESNSPPPPVILIMITSPYHEKSGGGWSWQHQLIGPIETVLHTRNGSQHVRRNLEAQLLANLTNKTVNDSASDKAASTDNGAYTAQKSAGPTKPAKTFPPVTVLRFCNTTNEDLQTLSWHLTASQKSALHKTWNDHYGDNGDFNNEVAALKHLLDPANQPDIPSAHACPAPKTN